MRKIYLPVLLLMLSSCSVRIGYLGSSFPATSQVDVFVERQAVKKPYDIIGKGYVHNPIGEPSVEKIQRKSVAKAKAQGAHAVVIEDFLVYGNNMTIVSTGDTSHKVTTGSAAVTAFPNFSIYFIRYKNP